MSETINNIEIQILRYKIEGRKYWYGIDLSTELKKQIEEKFTIGYILEFHPCQQNKLWEVVITIL